MGKMKKKIMISFLIIVMLFSTLLLSAVDASSYQSRPNTTYVNTTANNFAVNIRKMEADGGTLGMEATIDETTLLQTNETNGVDVHMIKNTEWGTVEMLTCSVYGSSTSTTTESSTGNASGVYQLSGYRNVTGSASSTKCYYYDYEYTAGVFNGATNNYMSILATADSRYVNKYNCSSIRGDGYDLGTISFPTNALPVAIRGGQIGSGVIPNLKNSSQYNGNYQYDFKGGNYSNIPYYYFFYSRACLVVGERTIKMCF